jgi:hypothetical protein
MRSGLPQQTLMNIGDGGTQQENVQNYSDSESSVKINVNAMIAFMMLIFTVCQVYVAYLAKENALAMMQTSFYNIVHENANKMYANDKANAHFDIPVAYDNEEKPWILFNEIFNYLDMLEIACSLYESDRIDKKDFPIFYKGHLESAVRFLGEVSDGKNYENILKVSEKLKDERTNGVNK